MARLLLLASSRAQEVPRSVYSMALAGLGCVAWLPLLRACHARVARRGAARRLSDVYGGHCSTNVALALPFQFTYHVVPLAYAIAAMSGRWPRSQW